MEFKDPVDTGSVLTTEVVDFDGIAYANLRSRFKDSGGNFTHVAVFFTGPMLADLRDELERLMIKLEE